MKARPKCVIVTGRPGSGKTTLARKLCELLHMPMLSRDEIKEGFISSFGVSHEKLPADTNRKVTKLFFSATQMFLEAKISVVVEAAFQHRLWEEVFPRWSSMSQLFFIICDVNPDLCARRHLERGLSDAKSDVYFSNRSIAGEIKISFHESGRINYSFTSDSINKKKELENQFRHIKQWEINTKKPLFRIIVPDSELKESTFKFHKKTKFIPAPNEGYASHLYIYITDINIEASMPDDFSLLFEQQLVNKNWLSIIRHKEEITKNNKDLYIEAKKQVKKIANDYSGKAKDIRGYLFLNGGSGPNGLVDISF